MRLLHASFFGADVNAAKEDGLCVAQGMGGASAQCPALDITPAAIVLQGITRVLLIRVLHEKRGLGTLTVVVLPLGAQAIRLAIPQVIDEEGARQN